MSGPSGAGGSDGVVRSSALSFVAGAAPAQMAEEQPGTAKDGADRLMPAGLKALCDIYSTLYPDQSNPLQVTTRLKYWLGGHDPLDYISMYWNPGKPDENIPPHWHYVSFGLSDLHGDGRVHAPPDRVLLAGGGAPPSGFGFELSMRLYAGDRQPPPLWPAALLQALARYVFTTGNKFCPGDHISWHAPLDGAATSRVRHLLVASDARLPAAGTPHGTVAFLQMVGCTGRELRAAQRGSGFDVLKLIAADHSCGDPYLVTRVQRRRSARGVRSRAQRAGAAPLAGVSARLAVRRYRPGDESPTPPPCREPPSPPAPQSPSPLPEALTQQIKDTLQRGLTTMSVDRSGPEGHTGMSTDSFQMSSMERALPQIPELMQNSWRGDETEILDGVHLVLNAEGASVLPLAIDGRVLHGGHFTWRSLCGGRAATVLAAAVAGAHASQRHPYVVKGGWLQMLIPKELALDMSKKVAILAKLAETDSESDSEEESERDDTKIALPLTLSWSKYKLKITVVHDNELL